jgi:uncharacterized protein (TIGR02996 family)
MSNATTRDDLLRRILLEPDDDAPRLVLADWLEENGDDADRARAEFVRVQCELWGRGRYRAPEGDWRYAPPPPAWQTERDALLLARERELSGLHGDHWARPVWEAACFPPTPMHDTAFDVSGNPRYHHACSEYASDRGRKLSWTFRRGFVEVVAMDAAAWIRHGDDLSRAAPLREVRLTGRLGARCWVDPSYGSLGVLTADDPTADLPLREMSRTVAYPNRGDAPPVEQLLAVIWPGIRFILPT